MIHDPGCPQSRGSRFNCRCRELAARAPQTAVSSDQRMTHDPLCPITKPCCGGDEQHPDSTQWCSDCGSTCVCDLLAKADQRGATRALDKARNAVAALIHNNMCDCELCWWTAPAVDAVNALRHP